MQISSFQEEETMAGTFITRAKVTPEWAATSCHTVSTRSVSMKGLGTRRRVPLFAAAWKYRARRGTVFAAIAARLLDSTASSSPRPLTFPPRGKTHQSDRTRSPNEHTFDASSNVSLRGSRTCWEYDSLLPKETSLPANLLLPRSSPRYVVYDK